MKHYLYFFYDPENGSEFFATEKEALAYAEETLDLYREAAQDDGWDEEVEKIVVGKITHRIEKCNVVKKRGNWMRMAMTKTACIGEKRNLKKCTIINL